MTDLQWQDLLRVIRGELLHPLPVGLIVDSPWLPGWAGVSILDYFTDEQAWMEANLRVVRRFPRIMFLPGFWAEYGMCTEPSAFGAKCLWHENAFPSVERTLYDYREVDRVKKPNCRTDGLAPFVLKRLMHRRAAIEEAGHSIRFAVARGPLNVASYLLGHTEFLIGVKTAPEETHKLLAVVTDYLVDWIALQAETFDTIDGIFLLDDLIGFLRDDDFREFALPYLARIFASRRVSVRFLHNDAAGIVTARHLSAMGVNLFNFSFNHSLGAMREAAGEGVVLLGNIPPRDVLAGGTPEDVRRWTAAALAPMPDRRRVVVSCGGGAPPGAATENLQAMCDAAEAAT
jgi:uroporphyrinogen-III decarboxylase